MEYLPIRVSTLRGDEKVPFDLYLPPGGKYLHYIKEGDSFEGTRLERLRQKKLKKMFLRLEHEYKYQDYIQRNLDAAFSRSSTKNVVNRAEIAQGVSQAAVEGVIENPQDIVAYDHAKDIAGKYLGLLTDKSEVVKLVLGMPNIEKNLAHHGVTVATLAVALAPQMGVTDAKSLELLTLGAYLHDIGHGDNEGLFQKPLAYLTPAELALYRKHPEVGAAKAQDLKHFDQNVIDIIMQHEETGNGAGYPQKLFEPRINRLAFIVGLCNVWDRMVTVEGIEKSAALKKLTIDNVGKFPLEAINALKRIVS